MATPAKPTPTMDPNQKAMLLQGITQLEMMALAFGNAPERVQKAAKEFTDSLKEWANV